MGADDSMKKLTRKKSSKKKRKEDSYMGISRPSQKEETFYRASEEEKKKKKKKKKKSPNDSKDGAKMFELHSMEDEMPEISGGNKRSEKLKGNKRKKGEIASRETEELDSCHINKDDERISDGEYAQSEQGEDKLQKSRKKKRKNVENINNVNECIEKDDASEQQNDSKPEDHFANARELNEGDTRRKSKTGKSKKPEKRKKKRQLVENDLSSENLLEKRGEEKRGEDAEDEVYQMSSGDENYSKGMKKWITQYHQSRPGFKVLQERIDDFIMAHEAKEAQARAEREAQAAEGGWTVVVHHKGRKKTTDAESGIAVGSVAQAAVLDKMGKKKNKEVGLDFYRFQKREAHRNEIMMLQSKFEQDKKRIQQMRAARKFRPY